jgi:branched-chain amino acid transport system substrate-binding protein
VLGEVASGRSLAAAPICQANHVPMVTPSSVNVKITQVGDYIFRTCFTDSFQGSVCARFAYNSLHVKKAVVLKDVKSEYSVGLDQFFSTKFKSLGGEIIGEQAYSGGDNDFKAQLTAIKAMNPEVIFLPGYYTEAALIIKQARELGIMIPIVGGDGWESARLFEIGGAAMKNAFYANHYTPSDTNPAVQRFVNAFEEKYRETPDAIAALAYDAGKIVFAAMSQAGSTDGLKLRDAIAAVKNFQGVTGTITIGPDRNAKKSAVIVEAKDGKPVFRERIEAESND